MRTIPLRLALVSALAISTAPCPAPAAGAAITHTQFAEAYVACNNAAWEGKSRGLIMAEKEPTMSDRIRGLDSPNVRGFVGEGLYFDGVYGNFQPRAAATVGWALATKAFADRGEVEPRFRNRGAAIAFLRDRNLNGIDALSDREVGAIATELDLSSHGAGRFAITPIAPGTRLGDPLHAAAARAMLVKVGTHFDVGSKKTIAQPGRACPKNVMSGLFRGAS
jgi:hypothetical protein